MPRDPRYLRGLHDGAPRDDLATRHLACAFSENTELLQKYLEFYHPFHTTAGVLEPAVP